MDLFRAQGPQTLPQALLTRATANRPQHPAVPGAAHDLELHSSLVLGDLLPDLHAAPWSVRAAG